MKRTASEALLFRAIAWNVKALEALEELIEDRNSWRRIAEQNGMALDSCYECLERLQGIR